jgi:hypothetical protein
MCGKNFLLKNVVFTAVTINSAVFWDSMTPFGLLTNRRFGKTYRFYLPGERLVYVKFERTAQKSPVSAVCALPPEVFVTAEELVRR